MLPTMSRDKLEKVLCLPYKTNVIHLFIPVEKCYSFISPVDKKICSSY